MKRLLAKVGCDLNDLQTFQKYVVRKGDAAHSDKCATSKFDKSSRILKNKRHQRMPHLERLSLKKLKAGISKVSYSLSL